MNRLYCYTTQAVHQQGAATPTIFNTASSEDLGEEQAVLNLVGTTQPLHQHSTSAPSIFNTASSEDLGEEQAVSNFVGTTHALH